MNATIEWVIEWMQCVPQEGQLTDVVITAGWRCNGTQEGYTATVYSTCSLPPADPQNFTPYANLTQDQVLGWCYANGVNKDSAEAAVAQQIQNQINPPVVNMTPPWSTPK